MKNAKRRFCYLRGHSLRLRRFQALLITQLISELSRCQLPASGTDTRQHLHPEDKIMLNRRIRGVFAPLTIALIACLALGYGSSAQVAQPQ